MGSRMTAQVTQRTPNATRCAARGEERALLFVLIERPHCQAIPGPIVVRDGPRVCPKFHSLNEFSHGGTRPPADGLGRTTGCDPEEPLDLLGRDRVQ